MNARTPDIVLIFPDQHRGDVLGALGSPVRTPTLDRLAAEGTLFERCYTQGPLCMPARASMTTGRYVHQHGVKGNATDTPADGGTFLWQLREAGYRTAAVGKCHLLRPGLESQRPDRYWDGMRALGFSDPDLANGGKHESAMVPNSYQAYLRDRGLLDAYTDYFTRTGRLHHGHAEPMPLPAEAYLDWWVGDLAVDFLAGYDDDAPLFAHIGFPGPHHPFDAPTEWVDAYRDVEPLGHQVAPAKPTPYQQTMLDILGPFDADLARRFTAAYYGNVSLIDHKIAEILEVLVARNRPTVVIYTSDHGEMLGEHQLLEKIVFYEPAVHVPLIVHGIDMPDAPTSDPVQLIDVPTTIMAIAGVAPHPLDEGRDLRLAARPAVFSEHAGYAMAVAGTTKVVCHAGDGSAAECYDLAADPMEIDNLALEVAGRAVIEQMWEEHLHPFLADAPADHAPDRPPSTISRGMLVNAREGGREDWKAR